MRLNDTLFIHSLMHNWMYLLAVVNFVENLLSAAVWMLYMVDMRFPRMAW